MHSDLIHWRELTGLSLEAALEASADCPVILAGQGSLSFRRQVAYSYDVRTGRSQIPARVNGKALATSRWRADDLRAAISLRAGELRVTVESQSAASDVSVQIPDSDLPDELLGAILGIHAWHWPGCEALPATSGIQPFAGMWNGLNQEELRRLWLGDGAATDAELQGMARLRTASLNWVSVACLQPGPPFAYSGVGAEWLEARMRRWCGRGGESHETVPAARRLRARINTLTPAAIAAALRVLAARRGLIFEHTFPASAEGLAALKAALTGSGEAAPGKIQIPLWMPAAGNRESWDRITFATLADGSIVACDEAGGTAPLEAEVRMPAHQARQFLAASALGISVPDAEGGEEADVDIRVNYRLTDAQAQSWAELPPERSAAYFPCASFVSTTIQQALRRWAPATLLADVERLLDLKQGPAYLLYQASAPYRPRTREAFSHELLDAAHVRILYRSAAAQLKQLLPPVEARLLQLGRKDVARMYTARRIGSCLERVRGELPRALASLLAAETTVIEDLIRIATQLSDAARETGGEGDLRARRGNGALREIGKALQAGLRHAVRGQAIEWLAPLVCAEATRGMAAAVGKASGCEMVMEVRAGQWTICKAFDSEDLGSEALIQSSDGEADKAI